MTDVPPVYIVKIVTPFVFTDNLTHPINGICSEPQNDKISIFYLFTKSAQVCNLPC